MTVRFLFLFVLIFCNAFLKSQVVPVFEKYAIKQDSLMMKAYDKRDTIEFKKLLDDLLLNYKALDNEMQKKYEMVITGANYDFACTFSIMGNKLKALEYLEKSRYTNYKHMLVDTDLDNIRKEKRFKDCLKYAKDNSPDYLATLKNAAKYNDKDNTAKSYFTYQSNDNANLKLLKDTYHLDSIAGTGNEISKILNLLHWVHNLVPHDGVIHNPDIMNAASMINVCKNENRGLNCWGLSVVLNECYLALGYKSRYVRCLPKDSTDTDCHVIVTVYSTTYKKWLWIDPTFDAYIMNENGDLLSIQEVRERLINSKQLIINPEANWNHKTSETKEEYLYKYMAKNLYRLESPINSEFDYETDLNGKLIKYMDLNPIDYNGYKNSGRKAKRGLSSYDLVVTNNPNIFWANPE